MLCKTKKEIIKLVEEYYRATDAYCRVIYNCNSECSVREMNRLGNEEEKAKANLYELIESL